MRKPCSRGDWISRGRVVGMLFQHCGEKKNGKEKSSAGKENEKSAGKRFCPWIYYPITSGLISVDPGRPR